MFGQQQQQQQPFSSGLFGGSTFGQQNKPAGFGFGTPQQQTGLFGQQQQQQPSTSGLFGSSTFGQQNKPAGFGFATPQQQTGLFGQQQQQQPSTSGLFGSNTFGQQNKTGFGFGTPQPQTGLFGQQQPQAQPQGSSLFQPTGSANIFGQSSTFGSAGTAQTGTVIKFTPITGTDTVQKSGVATSINTKHHCITCMKEYEGKSLEELRYEDYLANRKGPQQQTGFGAAPFGAPASSAPSLFGQTENKPAFGQTAAFGQTQSTFGQPSTGFGLQNQQNTGLFGKPTTGFGTPASGASTFGFGTNTSAATPFGATQQPKPFGTTTQPLFGANTTQPTSGFGTGLFGQQSAPNITGSSLFGKTTQATTGFGGTGQSTGFAFPQTSTTTSSLFQQPKLNTGFGLFGQTPTTSTGFGQTNTFGQQQSAFGGSTFGKPPGSTFTPVATQSFGSSFGSAPTQSGLGFGTAQPKFGTTGTTGLFSGSTFQTPTAGGFNFQQQQPQQPLQFPTAEQTDTAMLANLSTSPFPVSPHLASLTPTRKTDPSNYATNRAELNAILESSTKVAPSTPKLKLKPIKSGKVSSMFGSPEEEGSELYENYMMKNQKRLYIRNATENDESIFSDPDEDLLEAIKKVKEPTENDLTENSINFQDDSAAVRSRSSTILQGKNTEVSENKRPTEVENKPDENGESEKENEPPKKHPCGVILTRPEYYTVPPLEELEKYKNEDGTCIIKGFTIGRVGYGNVHFPDPMDVAGLNLDDLVFIRHKEVTIYPDDSKKPPLGQGLNRRAQITLDHIYPRAPGSSTDITDVDEILRIGFVDRLKEVSKKQESKFLEYRPETGSWVFEVRHFSKYGLGEDEEVMTIPAKDTPQDSDKSRDREKDKDKEIAKSKKGTVSPAATSTITTMDELRIDTSKEKMIQQTLEESYDLGGYMEDITSVLDLSTKVHQEMVYPRRDVMLLKHAFYGDDESTSPMQEDISVDIPDYLHHMLEMDEEVMYVDKQVSPPKRAPVYALPKISILQNISGKIPPEKSLVRGVRSCMDLAIFKGMASRCGWMKGFRHFFVGEDVYIGRHATSIVHLRDIVQSDSNSDTMMEFLRKALDIVHSEAVCKNDENNYPFFSIREGSSYLVKQTELFTKAVEALNYNEHVKYISSIWELCHALWAPLIESTDLRKDYLSNWLRKTVNKPVVDPWLLTHGETLPFPDLIKSVFEYLSINCIQEASELSMSNNCPQLSMLITQLNATEVYRDLLREQLVFWYNSSAEEFLTHDMKKIYLLLSGNALFGDVNICEGLDWKRAFGMHLWYVAPSHAPLHEAVKVYREAFESEEPYAPKPCPPYAVGQENAQAYDVLYHILMLYCSRAYVLNHVLDPSTHTSDPLDYRMSWFLLQLFRSLQIGLIDEMSETLITTNFANQLENINEWQWAVFVLLFIKDSTLRKKHVIEVLERNLSTEVTEETNEIDYLLVHKMKVPTQWIHQVKAHKASLFNQHLYAYTHYAYAGDYYKSNDIFVTYILPDMFVNEQFDQLQLALKPISPYCNDISSWPNEIGLVLDFLELQNRFESVSEQNELMHLHTALVTLVKRLPSFPTKTNLQKLCVAELSRKCVLLQRFLVEKVEDPLFKHSFIQVLDHLVMPPDYIYIEGLYYLLEMVGRL